MPVVIDAKSGIRGRLFNCDTGQEILFARRISLPDNPAEPGEFEALQKTADGRWVRDYSGKLILKRGRCRLRFEPDAAQPPRKPANGNGTIKHRVKLQAPKWERVADEFPENCQHYGCIRMAIWQVSDEVQIEPIIHDGRRFSQAKLIGCRFYCDWHYQGPRLYDAKGEMIEQTEEIGARPQ